MPERRESDSEITIDGRPVRVPEGVTLLAALYAAGRFATRRSLSGEARAPLCGMGGCYECRVLVNGAVRRSCLTLAEPGMEVALILPVRMTQEAEHA
ncbi:(2Fe-2S)-binding protein (plasmid) [Deinococcus radiomollis]|uniref:(2Fe-2S)-binding protein n=1 Tax=Deinococcus radiomollis TaxID=468916 RepID=UPI003892082D